MTGRRRKIGVIMGGISAEREISLMTGKAVAEALIKRNYEVEMLDVAEDIVRVLLNVRIDAAFIALHGKFGEDGTVQGLLELLRIPYTGSGILASALAMNKIFSKKLFEMAGLPVPAYTVIRKKGEIAPQPLPPGPPWVVKPSGEGSSVGVSIVSDEEKLKTALEEARKYDETILVESYIPGREISVGVLDGKALGAIEIVPQKNHFYSYKAKYEEGGSKHIFPAPISSEKYEEALRLAEKANEVLECEGAIRVDMRLGENGGFFILEVNSLPGMTPVSLLPEIARGVGISFEELCERLVEGARLKIR